MGGKERHQQKRDLFFGQSIPHDEHKDVKSKNQLLSRMSSLTFSIKVLL